MRKIDSSTVIFYFCLFFMMLVASGCVSSNTQLRGDIDQYKPSTASPIDGSWITPWNDRVIVDRGRVYYPDFKPPMTILKNLKRVGPGRYRAENTGSKQIQGNNITLSVVAANKLVIITDITEVAYTLLEAKNTKWYLTDFNMAKKNVVPAIKQIEPIVITQAAVEPSKVVRGDIILIKALFSVFDPKSSRKKLPVEYYYEILNQGKTIYTSPVKTIQTDNGAKTPLEIELKANSHIGDYKILLKLSQEKETAQMDMNFSIITPEEAKSYVAINPSSPLPKEALLEDRLLGKWKFVMGENTKHVSELVISKKDNQLVGDLSNSGATTQWVKLKIDGNTLVLTFKDITSVKGCWYEGQNIITFNDEMNYMPARSRIADGSWCVSIGQVFKSTMIKME